jgi:hypothetical protein
MNKKQLIEAILEEADIHHNISIKFSKTPKYEEGELDVLREAGFMLECFVSEWQREPINDSGNRNLCNCKKYICKKEEFNPENGYSGRVYLDYAGKWMNLDEATAAGYVDTINIRNFTIDGACKKHDLYHLYSSGRSGATLYWDKYWTESNSRGCYFKYDSSELGEMDSQELKVILKEVIAYNKSIEGLMEDFYSQLENRLEENRAEKKDEAEAELKYQKTKNTVIESGYIKRLVSEIL